MDHRSSQEITLPVPMPAVPPPAAKPRSTTGARRTAMRMMKRQSVGLVAVYEQDPMASDTGQRMLIFETPSFCIRVTEFPVDWHRLSDDQLSDMRRRAS